MYRVISATFRFIASCDSLFARERRVIFATAVKVMSGLIICAAVSLISASAGISGGALFDGLHGKVKEVSVETWAYRKNRMGINQKQYDGKTVTTFRSDGRATDRTSYLSDGTVRAKYSYTYNDQGDVIRIDHYDAYDRKTTKTLYFYDYAAGSFIEKEYYEDGWVNNRRKYVYDDKGHLRDKISYHVTDKPVGIDEDSEEYKKLIAAKDTDLDTVFARTVYTFDDRGNPAEIIDLDPKDNSAYEKTVYSYLDNRLVQTESYKRNILRTREKFVYDKTGNLTAKESYDPVSLKKISAVRYFHNAAARLIREEFYRVHGGLAYAITGKTTYTYDAQGNVSEKTAYSGSQPFSIEINRYIYY